MTAEFSHWKAPCLRSALPRCSRRSTPPSASLPSTPHLFVLCIHWSFFDSFGDRCSWACDRKFSLPDFNLSPAPPSPAHSLIYCISHVPYLWDLTGKGEFRNPICHSSFSIWCQAFCSHNQLRSSVPMSPFLLFSLPPSLPQPNQCAYLCKQL